MDDIFFCKTEYNSLTFRVVDYYTKQSYLFINYNDETRPILNKINSQGISSSDRETLKKYYNIPIETFRDTKCIDEIILIDDTVQTLFNKIAIHCVKSKYIGKLLYCWTEKSGKKIPLSFRYKDDSIEIGIPDTNPDSKFVDSDNKPISNRIDNKTYTILNDLRIEIDTIYFVTLKDYIEHTFPDSISNIESVYYGIVRKYWINIDDIEYLKNNVNIQPKYEQYKKELQTIHKQTDTLETFYDDMIICDNYNMKLLKLRTNSSDITVNIIKLFAEIELSPEIVFSKLILDSYDDSYFKIYKPSIIDNRITKDLCKSWMSDYKIIVNNFPKYLHSDNVVCFKLIQNIILYH